MTVRRAEAIAAHRRRERVTHIPTEAWRQGDPPATMVGELSPNDLGGRVVIRTGDFLGTVYGTLIGIEPHPSLVAFSCVQLQGKRLLTLRNDLETIVVDDLGPRARVYG